MATEILRPNAAGDETNIRFQIPNSTNHWDKVDEAIVDDGSTYVFEGFNAYYRDLYNLPVHSVGLGIINSITIYIRICAETEAIATAYATVSQKSGTTVTDGTEQSTTAWATKSQTYTTNPATGLAYTWDEIDALQIGLQLKSGEAGFQAWCTQVYVEIDCTGVPVIYIITASSGPNGQIAPSGDVVVNSGGDQTFVMTPDTGYMTDQILIDGNPV